jgi:Xaa-Pro aminopeptidase
LIDLWGGHSSGDVPADQTWMGFMGPELPEEAAEIWTVVRDARDAGFRFLQERFASGSEVRGYEVDDVCRAHIREHGFGEQFVHRTGHSMDTDLHGSGPNLDNLETKDDRLLVPGVGFSIEPGIYFTDRIGVRSEINVYWGADGPIITGPDPQVEVFLLLED